MEEKFIELSQLQSAIAECVEGLEYWVRVEIESHRVSRGHHYLSLIQKSEDGEILARAEGRIWRTQAGMIAEFEQVTGQEFVAGISVVVMASVTYHPVYGLALNISGISADFTLGQKELERRRTIEYLESTGLMDRQKSLQLPLLPRRIAVISSEDAAGYGDFCRHIDQNTYGYKFDFRLFTAAVQGERAPASIEAAFAQAQREGGFDLVLLLRGGGGESDLACFDDRTVCEAVARCTVPVITAIGHERDCHIADMVANEYCKTPTALADRLIDWVSEVEAEVDRCCSNIRFALNAAVARMQSQVEIIVSSIKSSDPRNILSQGYVLAADEKGVIIKSASNGKAGDRFSLRFRDGRWQCVVETIKQ